MYVASFLLFSLSSSLLRPIMVTYLYARVLGITPKSDDAALPSPAPPAPSLAAVREAAKMLDSQLRTLYAALPARTALVLFTGHDNPWPMAVLSARKSAFESALRVGMGELEGKEGKEMWWTSADGRALVEMARRGLLVLAVKT